MKKTLLIAVLFASFAVFTNESKAQYQSFSWSKTTLTGADTATGTVSYPFSTVCGIEPTFTRSASTMAGKAYLYGAIQNEYVLLDSLTVSTTSVQRGGGWNGVTQSKLILPYFYKYKIVYYQTGGTGTVSAVALTRSGGR